MTTISSSNEPLRELITSVQQLDAHVQHSAVKMQELAEREENLERSRRRHRVWIVLTVFGLALDLALSGLFLHQHNQQVCVNNLLKSRQVINQRNFEAEYDKVAGQVAGLKKLRSASGRGDQATALAGFDQFITASELYLKRITSIHNDQVKHPLGQC